MLKPMLVIVLSMACLYFFHTFIDVHKPFFTVVIYQVLLYGYRNFNELYSFLS